MSINVENIISEYERNKTAQQRIVNIQENMGYKTSGSEMYSAELISSVRNSKSEVPGKYSYVPKLTAVFSDGEVFDLLNYTTIIQGEINLDDYVFPLFSVRLDLPVNYIPKFQMDDEMEFKFELLYNPTEAVDSASMYNTLWSIMLKKVKQESSPVIADTLIYEENQQYLRLNPLELKLVPTECLDANKNLFSGVYSNCSVSQMLCLITERLKGKTFIETPDNIRLYDQIIFPPSNIFYAIEYLDNYFGIYDRGLKMFYGFGLSMIMPMNYTTDVGLNKVKVTFSSSTQSGIDTYTYLGGGISKLGDDNYISITPDKVKILDKRHFVKENLGSIISTYSRDDDTYFEQIRNYDYTQTNSNTPSIEKVKSYVNQYNNTNKEKEYLLNTTYTKQIELLLDDAILDPESWFKPFRINFDSPNYSYLDNDYSLKGYYFRFTRLSNTNGTSGFNVNSAIELTQI